MKIPKCC